MNARENESSFTNNVRPALLLTSILAVASFLLWMPIVAALESGGPDGANKVSVDGQSQSGPAVAEKSTKPSMPGSKTAPKEGALPPAIPRNGKKMSMENALKLPPRITSGEQPAPGEAEGLGLSEAGGQMGALAKPRSAKKYLTVVLLVRVDGTSQVLSATEVEGEPVVSNEVLGDFAYKVADGTTMLATRSLPGDIFEAHSFGGPPESPQEQYVQRLKETTIVVKVPQRNLDSFQWSEIEVRHIVTILPVALSCLACANFFGSICVPGSSVSHRSRSAPNPAAVPRRLTWGTTSKTPTYSGKCSCEMPRCGQSHARRRDQNPAIGLTCMSCKPSPASS